MFFRRIISAVLGLPCAAIKWSGGYEFRLAYPTELGYYVRLFGDNVFLDKTNREWHWVISPKPTSNERE